MDAAQTKGLTAVYVATVLKPNAWSRLSFGVLRELQSLAEAVDLLSSRSVVRSGSVDNVIWSSGSGEKGRTDSSPTASGSVETESARGERAVPRPCSALEERGRRRRAPIRSAKRSGGRKMGEERSPEESAME